MDSTKLFKNDPPEVLVLPPNILEELGINLGNIQSYTNGTEAKSVAAALTDDTSTSIKDGADGLPNIHNNEYHIESSILETAKLMKASVFLSPTFTNLKPNNVINDLHNKKIKTETVQCNGSLEVNNTKVIGLFNKPVSFFEKNDSDSQEVRNNHCKDVLPNLSKKINITSEEIIDSKKIEKLITHEILEKCNLVPVPITAIITKNTVNFTNSKDSIKSCKETNKIECNGGNNKNSGNMLSANGLTTEEMKNPTLNLKNQTYKEMVLKKPKNDDVTKILKNVNIEHEICEDINSNHKSTDNNSIERNVVSKLNGMAYKGNIDTSNELSEKNSDSVEKNDNISDNHEDVNFVNGVSEDIHDTELNKEKSFTITGKECVSVDFEKTVYILQEKDSEHCNENIKSKNITQSDGVTQSNSIDTTNSDSKQKVAIELELSHIENREICNNNKVINVNKNKVKSKLCIQGVEKPGGESDSDHKGIYVKDLKTYSRGKRTKFSKAVFVGNQDCLKSNLDIDVNINFNINNSYRIKEQKTQKFCICQDFGYFSYYDKDIDYQHIHFWEQKGSECSLDMLLSIYEENKIIEINVPEIDHNEINIGVKDETESKNNVYNICWMNLDGIPKNTKGIIESFERPNQQATILQTSDVIVNSQSNNTEVLSRKSNETVSQFGNVDLQNISSKSSIHNKLNQSNKRNRKRKRTEDDIDEIKAIPNISAKNKNDNVDDSKIVNKKNAVANEVKLNESFVENVPSTNNFLRKSVITNKSSKVDDNTIAIINQAEELVADDILMPKNKLSKVNINTDKKSNQNKKETIVTNNHPSETDLKMIKKRKGSLVFSEGSSEKKKKNKEIRIKCGVCKNEVESSKWENHVINNHCFIAWEDGQQFDFNNEDLFNKLKQHLNDNGKLICMICDKVIKRVKKFLNHVEGCITYKKPLEMSDDSINESGPSRLRAKPVICGVCKTEVSKILWMEHMANEHNYLAWKEGETPLDSHDEDAVCEHLDSLITNVGKIECNACGLSYKCANSFLKHTQKCGKPNEGKETSVEVKAETSINCGVCLNNVLTVDWWNHISKEHKYLAWKEGEPELDVGDSHRVYEYLHQLSKQLGGLRCGKCGCRRKYVNSFLKHVESCDGEENPNCTMDSTMNESIISMNNGLDTDNSSSNLDVISKCGVCQKEVDNKDWEFHIKMHHSYKAWKNGQTPLDLDDEEQVYNHLYTMSKKYNGLTCNRCGMTRKYVKVFLHHIESCTSQLPGDINDDNLQEETYKCGACNEMIPAKDWKSHAMIKHYNVAWRDGQTPIDSRNPTAVEKCLKEYKQVYNKYVCNVCGISRVSAIGFFAHVVQCGKTEEEIDPHRDLCDICNNKYLIIYKNQHISMHRDQEYAKQRKLNLEMENEEKKKQIITKADNQIQPERRLAAERARNVIEKYKKYKHNCTTCDFGADSEDDVKNHTCKKMEYNFSDSEDSVQLSSEPESDDTDVNSDLSNEEHEEIQKSAPSKKKKHADPNPAAAFFPFSVQNPKSYLTETAEDFRKNHLTSNILYPQWRTCKFEVVPDELLSNYLPNSEESCKVQLNKEDWITVKKFEGVIDQKWASVAYSGGCVGSVSWCPARQGDAGDELQHFLGVAAHRGHDAPRLHAHHLHAHAGLLQIWDYGDLARSPKFALGIAHDFGTVWAKDWCPSGARDMLIDSDTNNPQRLGLLAVACSNGSAYIFSVPYPSTITEGKKKVFKLAPVAELRLTRGNRQSFQATAINWPAEIGHSTIIVGYSDGTTALFNLDCDSPLLTDTENDMKIFYPFQDERTHNSCVTAVSWSVGAVGSSSATGGARAGLRRGGGRGGRHTRSAVTATAAAFMPHWPDLLLAGNDAIVYQAPNVVSWCGGGRRLGSQQAVCGCMNCGRVAIAAPPALRLVSAHPVHKHLHKITVALLQMKPLVNKKTKQKNDDLGTRLEPSTYEDAIKKYGVELKIIESFDKSYLQQSNKPRDHYPERFPLSDVSSMAFNTSPSQHKKLAVAIHSGLIFVITV